MSEQIKAAPNHHAFAGNREIFKAVKSTLQVSTSRSNGEIVERREIYLLAIPESHKLNQRFESIEFRLLESTSASPADEAGNAIVGSVNPYPEPVHVVLVVTPQLLSLLSQRQISQPHAEHAEFLIHIYPATSIPEWNQKESIPIYESVFLFRG